MVPFQLRLKAVAGIIRNTLPRLSKRLGCNSRKSSCAQFPLRAV